MKLSLAAFIHAYQLAAVERSECELRNPIVEVIAIRDLLLFHYHFKELEIFVWLSAKDS